MTPLEAVASIEHSKSMIKGIAKDQAMTAIFGVSFNMLKSLCIKEINEQNMQLEMDNMENQRIGCENKDTMSNIPLRRMIYELSKAINNTARVLAAKGSDEDPRRRFKEDEDDSQETDDLATGSMIVSTIPVGFVNANNGNEMLGEIKDEPVDDRIFANPQLLSAEELQVPKFEEDSIETAGNHMDNQMRGEIKDEPEDDRFFQNPDLFGDESLRMQKYAGEQFDTSPDYPYDNSDQHRGQQDYGTLSDPAGPSSKSNTNPVMLICPICGDYNNKRVGRSLSAIKTHLRKCHSKTVLSANLRMDCVCGYTTQYLSHVDCHGSYCAHNSFTMRRNEEKPGPGPLKIFRTETTVSWREDGSMSDFMGVAFVCPFCSQYVKRTLRNLETHIRSRHNRTCREAGLTFVCTCGYISKSVGDIMKHRKQCADSVFTMRLPE